MLNKELLAVGGSTGTSVATVSTGVFKFKPMGTGRMGGPVLGYGATLDGKYGNSNTDLYYTIGVLPKATLEGRQITEVFLLNNSNVYFTVNVNIGNVSGGDEEYSYCPEKLKLINHSTGNSVELLLHEAGSSSCWYSPDYVDETGTGDYLPLTIVDDFRNETEQLWEIVGYYERPTYKVTVGIGDYSGGSDSFEFYGYIEESNAGSISPQYYRGAKITAMTLNANLKPGAMPPGYVPIFYLEFDKYRDPSSDTLYFFTDLYSEPIELIKYDSNTYISQITLAVKEGDVVEFKLGVSPYPDGYTGSH